MKCNIIITIASQHISMYIVCVYYNNTTIHVGTEETVEQSYLATASKRRNRIIK